MQVLYNIKDANTSNANSDFDNSIKAIQDQEGSVSRNVKHKILAGSLDVPQVRIQANNDSAKQISAMILLI